MNFTRTVTEVARHFSDYINRVAFRRERFVLLRGKRPVAELRPIHPGVRACDLPSLFAGLPRFESQEAAAFDADVRKVRQALDAVPLRDRWSE